MSSRNEGGDREQGRRVRVRGLQGEGCGFGFGAEAELAAGGVDVVAFFQAQGGGDTGTFQGFGEGAAASVVGSLPGEALDVVVGDKIDFGVEESGEVGEGFGVGEVVVDPSKEDVFEGDHAAFTFEVMAAGSGEFGEGILAVDRHDAAADLIGGAMEGEGEAELFGFVGEATDLGGEAGSGDGDFAGAEAIAPGGVQEAEGGEQVVVIGEGFAHAHDDQVVHPSFAVRGGMVWGGGVQAVPTFGGEDLADDFIRGEVTFPAVQSAGAESAAVGATDLGGDADGVAIGAIAVEGGIGGDEDTFDEGAIGEAPEELTGGIGGALQAGEGGKAELEGFGQALAEGFGEIGHLVPAVGGARIQPLEELIEAPGGLMPILESLGELIAVQAADGRQGNRVHAGSVAKARRMVSVP